MINLDKIKNIFIIVSFLFGAIFYFTPGNYLNSRFDFLQSVFHSFMYEITVSVVVFLLITYRERIKIMFAKSFGRGYLKSLPVFLKCGLASILLASILFSFRPIKYTLVNRAFFYSNILPNKYINELVNRAGKLEYMGDYDNAIKVYKKVLNQSLSVSNQERINNKIIELSSGIELSENLSAKCQIISVTSTLRKSEFIRIKNAKRLNPLNEVINRKYNDYVNHIKISVKSLHNLVSDENAECVSIIESYGWLIIDKPLLSMVEKNNTNVCDLFNRAYKNYNNNDFEKELLADWYIEL